ncbi:MAG: STAS domain-containing protein [Solirubrobacterales bacterium]
MPQLNPPTASQSRIRPFRLFEQRIWPGCLEIGIEGELDLAVSDQLRIALDAAQAEPCHVLLSFDDCGFIDSSGLAVLVAAGRSCPIKADSCCSTASTVRSTACSCRSSATAASTAASR